MHRLHVKHRTLLGVLRRRRGVQRRLHIADRDRRTAGLHVALLIGQRDTDRVHAVVGIDVVHVGAELALIEVDRLVAGAIAPVDHERVVLRIVGKRDFQSRRASFVDRVDGHRDAQIEQIGIVDEAKGVVVRVVVDELLDSRRGTIVPDIAEGGGIGRHALRARRRHRIEVNDSAQGVAAEIVAAGADAQPGEVRWTELAGLPGIDDRAIADQQSDRVVPQIVAFEHGGAVKRIGDVGAIHVHARAVVGNRVIKQFSGSHLVGPRRFLHLDADYVVVEVVLLDRGVRPFSDPHAHVAVGYLVAVAWEAHDVARAVRNYADTPAIVVGPVHVADGVVDDRVRVAVEEQQDAVVRGRGDRIATKRIGRTPANTDSVLAAGDEVV